MIGCLVVSHGSIAEALVSAAEKIAGKCDSIFSFSSDDSLQQMTTDIENILKAKQFNDGLIIMVCLQGGSGWNICRAVTGKHTNIAMISGTNLPMILSFITKSKKYTFDQLVGLLVQDAKRGISDIKM